MRRRVLVWIGCLLGLLLAAPPLWVAVHLRDLPEPGDAALRVSPFDPAKGDGSENLRAVARSVHWSEEADERWRPLRDGRAQDPGWVRSMLDANRGAFAALDRFLGGPNVGIPVGDYDSIMSHSDSYMSLQVLAKLAVAEGWMLFREGHERAAFERVMLGMRIGRKLSDAYGANLLSLIFVTSTQGVSLYALEHMVRESSLDPDQARGLAEELSAQRWDSATWERAWSAEYQFFAASIHDMDEAMATDPPSALGADDGLASSILAWMPRDYVWQSNRTRLEMASQYLELQRRASLDCLVPTATQGGEVVPSEPMPLTMLLLPNPVGRGFAGMAASQLERFDVKRCQLETRIALVRAQIALRAYGQANGALPVSLAALVPDYLESIPVDRFGGAPLRYSRERAIVYSIGDDGIDAGGSDPPMQTDAHEPTIRVAL